jgi:heme-degrading monooxygenase HmoA
MVDVRKGNVAVIFVSARTGHDPEGYARAAAEMEREVSSAPGYLGHHSVGSPDGRGITVSYWADRAAAAAWKFHSRHSEVRAEGRRQWYRWYRVVVADVDRAYDWTA